eukprot:1268981-Amphidinium_carterae.1
MRVWTWFCSLALRTWMCIVSYKRCAVQLIRCSTRALAAGVVGAYTINVLFLKLRGHPATKQPLRRNGLQGSGIFGICQAICQLSVGSLECKNAQNGAQYVLQADLKRDSLLETKALEENLRDEIMTGAAMATHWMSVPELLQILLRSQQVRLVIYITSSPEL